MKYFTVITKDFTTPNSIFIVPLHNYYNLYDSFVFTICESSDKVVVSHRFAMTH